GMDDDDVAQGLLDLASSSGKAASKIGDLLPEIIGDEQKCKDRLLELLNDPEAERTDLVINGLQQLKSVCTDKEIVDAALDLETYSAGTRYEFLRASLIIDYPSDERIRELAKRELTLRQGQYAAVARAYGNDEEIRDEIISLCNVLPAPLRMIIARRLGNSSPDLQFTLSTLKDYDLEQDPQVKTEASIRYHMLLKRSGQNPDQALALLSHGIAAKGFDMDARRHAALCGLMSLDRLDVAAEVMERTFGETLNFLLAPGILKGNSACVRQIVNNWSSIQAAFGPEYMERLSPVSELYFWEVVCPYVDDASSAAGKRIYELLEESRPTSDNVNLLHFVSRTKPRSSILREWSLATLFKLSRRHPAARREAFAAAEILAEHFGGNPEVLKTCESQDLKSGLLEEVILALCYGWPDSEELERLFEQLRRNAPRLSNLTAWTLSCRKLPEGNLLDSLLQILSGYNVHYRYWSRWYVKPLIQRLQSDEELEQRLLSHLINGADPSEKASFARLLAMAGGLSPQFRDWCREEADRQLNSSFPEIGFDLVEGELRPVLHSLLDVFRSRDMTNSPY
ncbi:hypothetical protein ACFL2Q_19980, partial [Thermodesulfobacteriota bacterium]